MAPKILLPSLSRRLFPVFRSLVASVLYILSVVHGGCLPLVDWWLSTRGRLKERQLSTFSHPLPGGGGMDEAEKKPFAAAIAATHTPNHIEIKRGEGNGCDRRFISLFPRQFNSPSLPYSTLYIRFSLFLAQCLPGTSSSDGLEPCASCEKGSYQERYAETRCTRCPDGASTRDEKSCRIKLPAKKMFFFLCENCRRRGARTLQQCLRKKRYGFWSIYRI